MRPFPGVSVIHRIYSNHLRGHYLDAMSAIFASSGYTASMTPGPEACMPMPTGREPMWCDATPSKYDRVPWVLS